MSLSQIINTPRFILCHFGSMRFTAIFLAAILFARQVKWQL